MDHRKETNPLKREKLDKLRRLRELGLDPYPHSWSGSGERKAAADIQRDFAALKAGEKSDEEIFIAGRLMRKRDMGKAAFFNIQDQSGQLQCYIKKEGFAAAPPKGGALEAARTKNKSGEGRQAGHLSWDIWKLSDIGDILGAGGRVFRTKKGELSLRIESLSMLCKSLEILPEKYHGLEDKELKYRHRHLDLIMDPKSREVFQIRAKIIQAVRKFLDEKGFMEAETPVLQPVYGGAAAAPFETYFRRLNQKMYLKISPEIYLKKLIAGGFEKVYEIGKNFRNEGLDRSHSPEFLMLEYYEAYTDYEDQMKQFEDLVRHAAEETIFPKNRFKFEYQNREVDLSGPWLRMKIMDHESAIVSFLSDGGPPGSLENKERARSIKFHYPGKDYKGEDLDPKRFWEKITARFKEEKNPASKGGKTIKFDFPAFWRKILAEGRENPADGSLQSLKAWEDFRNLRFPSAQKTERLELSSQSKADHEIFRKIFSHFENLRRGSEKLLRYAKFLDPKGDFQEQERAIGAFESCLHSKAPPPAGETERVCAGLNSALDELSLKACEQTVEKYFWDPALITDFPLAGSPLTKASRENPRLVERFEPYIAGMEIGNAYTELNDPVEQRKRLESQKRWSGGRNGAGKEPETDSSARPRDGEKPSHPVDESFLHALETGMPPCGGAGLGIERLVMLLTNQSSIKDSMLFPFLRSKPEDRRRQNKKAECLSPQK